MRSHNLARLAGEIKRCTGGRNPGMDGGEVVVPLAPGRALHVASGPDQATVRIRSSDPARELTLEIRFEGASPVVRLTAPVAELEGVEDLQLRCRRFSVRARDAIELHSEGSLSQAAGGTLGLRGRNVDCVATRGSARVRANDDVQLLGEAILLNCDRPR